jgi:template-activating factor I
MSGKPQRKGPKVANTSGEDQYGVYDDPLVCLDSVTGLQTELDSLSEKCAEEILQVEQKYNALRKPFLEQRTEMIRNIPDFWLNVLLNHPQLSEIITEEDESALQALQSIEIEEDEDMKSGLRIRFYFSENDYFENRILTKEYLVDPNTSEPVSNGVQINWKPGKNLTQKLQGNVGAPGTKRTHEEAESFFLWFNDRQPASEDPVAEIIKEDLWPNPLAYYMNADRSLNEDDDDGEEGEGEGEGEGDYEEYDEEEEQAIIEEDEDEEDF